MSPEIKRRRLKGLLNASYINKRKYIFCPSDCRLSSLETKRPRAMTIGT